MFTFTEILQAYSAADQNAIQEMKNCLKDGYFILGPLSYELKVGGFQEELFVRLAKKRDFKTFFQIVDLCAQDQGFGHKMEWERSFLLFSRFENVDQKFVRELIKHPQFEGLKSFVQTKDIDSPAINHEFVPRNLLFGQVGKKIRCEMPDLSIKELALMKGLVDDMIAIQNLNAIRHWKAALSHFALVEAVQGMNLENTKLPKERWDFLLKAFGEEVEDEYSSTWGQKEKDLFLPMIEAKMISNLFLEGSAPPKTKQAKRKI